MALAQHRQRAQHVRVALARHEMAGRRARLGGAGLRRPAFGQVPCQGARRASAWRHSSWPARRSRGCWPARGRAAPRPRRRAAPAGVRGAVYSTSPPWTETTSGTRYAERRAASPAGTALWAWIRSNSDEWAAGAAPCRAPARPMLPTRGRRRARRRRVAHVCHVETVDSVCSGARQRDCAARAPHTAWVDFDKTTRAGGMSLGEHEYANLCSSIARCQGRQRAEAPKTGLLRLG